MAGQPPGNPLQPTFEGFVSSTMDALILFEACLCGRLSHVPRRPHDRERPTLIRSGNVFIYDEHSSGIKRWTDGVPWSPSRILGNFLIYRELDKPFQPGEKKRAMKRSKTEGVSKPISPRSSSAVGYGPVALAASAAVAQSSETSGDGESDRAFVGSLVDSYQFRDNGLLKKTISIQHMGVHHHLVSYYSLSDIKNKRLKSVSASEELFGISPRHELVTSGNFRSPVEDPDLMMDTTVVGLVPQLPYNTMPQRAVSIPQTPTYGHPQAWPAPQSYGHGSSYGVPPGMHPASYGQQQMVAAYAYDAGYGQARSGAYGSMAPTPRRHSAVPTTHGTAQLGYSSSTNGILPNGGGLAAHGLPGHPYLNGDIFSASAAGAAAENASDMATGGYGSVTTMGQNGGTHGLSGSVAHSNTGFEGPLSNGFEQSMVEMGMSNYGGALPESNGAGFGSASSHTTPTKTEPSELSPTSQEWDRPVPKPAAKHNTEW